MKVGDKVHYLPAHLPAEEAENGIVKSIPGHQDHVEECVFVVYNWGPNWNNYMNYTAALTPVKSLRKGWV